MGKPDHKLLGLLASSEVDMNEKGGIKKNQKKAAKRMASLANKNDLNQRLEGQFRPLTERQKLEVSARPQNGSTATIASMGMMTSMILQKCCIQFLGRRAFTTKRLCGHL